jgi:hypothetical protein
MVRGNLSGYRRQAVADLLELANQMDSVVNMLHFFGRSAADQSSF